MNVTLYLLEEAAPEKTTYEKTTYEKFCRQSSGNAKAFASVCKSLGVPSFDVR
jgi:hypothetical protein